jgi:PTH1 family peptidyl-tRNA hydrolase
MKILVVGLGNPGHSWTPHNIGADLLRTAFSLEKKVTKVGHLFFMYEPDFMNISGNVIKKFARKNSINNIIVLTDDIDTPVGRIVASFGTGHRGHNGIRNIIENFGNQFWKIRIGVGREEDVSEFVLRPIKDRSEFIKLLPQIREQIFSAVQKISKNQANNELLIQ